MIFKFLKRHFELVMGFLCLLSLFASYQNFGNAYQLMSGTFFGLALYYFFSAALVLFTRKYHQLIRILYFGGLWSITIGIVGIVFKFRLWYGSYVYLVVALVVNLIILVLATLLVKTRDEKIKDSWQIAFKPLMLRLFIFSLLFFPVFKMSNSFLFDNFHKYRDKKEYKALKIKMLEEPDSMTVIKIKELENQFIDGNTSSTEED